MLRMNQLNGFGVGREIPALLKAEIWIDPSDLRTMRQERTGASATTPCAVGDPVGSMFNKGTLGTWFTAVRDAARPILRANGSLLYLECVGANSQHFTTALPMSTNILTSAMSARLGSAGGWCGMQGSSSQNVDFQKYDGELYVGSQSNNELWFGSFSSSSSSVRNIFTEASTPICEIAGSSVSLSFFGNRAWDANIATVLGYDGHNQDADYYQYVSVYRALGAAEKAALQRYVNMKGGI
jgi:hypothetical protein